MIEFKVKVTDQAWENIPVIVRLDVEYLWHLPSDQDDVADDIAQHLAEMTFAPVRWNWEGSLQGHYYCPLEKVKSYEAQHSAPPPVFL